jgi:hypothetical protein
VLRDEPFRQDPLNGTEARICTPKRSAYHPPPPPTRCLEEYAYWNLKWHLFRRLQIFWIWLLSQRRIYSVTTYSFYIFCFVIILSATQTAENHPIHHSLLFGKNVKFFFFTNGLSLEPYRHQKRRQNISVYIFEKKNQGQFSVTFCRMLWVYRFR